MAKETTKKTTNVSACEQYVVDELKQAKSDLAKVTAELETLKHLHEKLVNVVIKGTKDFKIKKEQISTITTFTYVYFQGSFMALDNESLEQIGDLVELILTGQEILGKE